MNIKDNKMKINGIAMAHIVSGNFAGSLNEEVFPTVYHYSYYHTENESDLKKRKDFNHIVSDYLQHTKVNNRIKLSTYIDLLYLNDTIKLNEIHKEHGDVKAKGSTMVKLPILFFVDDGQKKVIRLSLDKIELVHSESTSALMNFLQENAKHFESQIPDDFFNKHYRN
jgi:hypothetical protein